MQFSARPTGHQGKEMRAFVVKQAQRQRFVPDGQAAAAVREAFVKYLRYELVCL